MPSLAEVERDAILAALNASDRPLSEIAAALRIHRNTLRRKMDAYGIVDPMHRRGAHIRRALKSVRDGAA